MFLHKGCWFCLLAFCSSYSCQGLSSEVPSRSRKTSRITHLNYLFWGLAFKLCITSGCTTLCWTPTILIVWSSRNAYKSPYYFSWVILRWLSLTVENKSAKFAWKAFVSVTKSWGIPTSFVCQTFRVWVEIEFLFRYCKLKLQFLAGIYYAGLRVGVGRRNPVS